MDEPDDDSVELAAYCAWLDLCEDGFLTLPDGSFYMPDDDLLITLCPRNGNFMRFRRARPQWFGS
jgi:hypothetical protein